MKRKRVFITAAGVASPIGTSVDGFYDSLEFSRPGIGRLRRVDAGRLRTKMGGECDLEAVIAGLGYDSLELPALREKIELRRNSKLAFALYAAGAAISAAGISGDKMKGAGFFTGAGLDAVDVGCLAGPPSPERHVSPEFPPSLIGEIVSLKFGFGRPPLSVVSACSASAQAIGEAYLSVRSGEVETAVAGGSDSMLFQFGVNAFNSIGALSEEDSDRPIRPFDASRSGTVPGEGAAYFCLQSEEGVARSGRRPVAEISGYGSSMDNSGHVQPDPGGEGASAAMRRALADSGLDARDIEYVNAHGTGTRSNDVSETLAIKKVFREHAAGLLVSSTKPFFGHLLSAAGAIELLCVLFAFERGLVPPTLGLERPDEGCDLDYVPNFARPKKIRRAMSNSFGLNGQNASIILTKA